MLITKEQFDALPTVGNNLVTTDDWFIGADGKQYKAVFGPTRLLSSEDTLGIKTNQRSTNWYAIVGNYDNFMVVAGCRIHYSQRVESITNTDRDVHEVRLIDALPGKVECYRPTYILDLSGNNTTKPE